MGKIMTDETGRGILAQLRIMNHRQVDVSSYEEIQSIVRAGLAAEYFEIGDQILVPWVNPDTQTEYQIPFDVVDFGDAMAIGDDEPRPAMWLQSHCCMPDYLAFDAQECFYVADDGLSAGTYHLSIGDSWGKLVAGDSWQFTLTQDVPAGGCLCGFYTPYETDPSAARVYSYASSSDTSALETSDISAGSGGADLGTYSKAGDDALNSYQRAGYGYNRWSHSGLRQYLNASKAGWWVAQNRFDRPPAYASKTGFMAGFEEEFLSVLGRVRLVTALNTVTDGGTTGGTQADVTYDTFFLPSGEQHYMQVNSSYGSVSGLEGAYWEYWRRTLGTGSPGAWGATYPQWITYQLGSTTARYVWMRSCYRSSANSVGGVNSSGYVGGHGASSTSGAAPACAIC